MVTDERTSRILAQAKQRRADVVGDFLSSHPVAVVCVFAFAALLTTVSWNTSPVLATASSEAGQVTDVSKP